MNQSGHQLYFIRKCKAYAPISKTFYGLGDVTATVPYVSQLLGYGRILNNETIVIQSCTGTRKTACVAHCATKHLAEHPDAKLLSIVTRTSLADQHCKSFEDLDMTTHQDVKGDLYDVRALAIYLSSVVRLQGLDDDEINLLYGLHR